MFVIHFLPPLALVPVLKLLDLISFTHFTHFSPQVNDLEMSNHCIQKTLIQWLARQFIKNGPPNNNSPLICSRCLSTVASYIKPKKPKGEIYRKVGLISYFNLNSALLIVYSFV